MVCFTQENPKQSDLSCWCCSLCLVNSSCRQITCCYHFYFHVLWLDIWYISFYSMYLTTMSLHLKLEKVWCCIQFDSLLPENLNCLASYFSTVNLVYAFLPEMRCLQFVHLFHLHYGTHGFMELLCSFIRWKAIEPLYNHFVLAFSEWHVSPPQLYRK